MGGGWIGWGKKGIKVVVGATELELEKVVDACVKVELG